MNAPDPAAQADSVLQAERARRPGWRNASGKRSPAWFRGEELDLVDATERRQLYDAATARMGPVPWPQFIAIGVVMGSVLWHGGTVWRWSYAAALAVLITGAVASTLLRRRNIRQHARLALRESADWPQRLEQARA